MAYTDIDKPSDYFETKLYTGTGSEQSITMDFAPNLVWLKSRNNTYNHNFFDSVRGVLKMLRPNTTNAEATISNTLTSFNSDGFTLGSDAGVNQSSSNQVSWNWKAGTSFTNDASSTGIGSIDSAGSVNTDAGFSIISYTGTGANATIAHGLGVAPKMIITKSRGTTNNWGVYHQSLGNTDALFLNLTAATDAASTYWNNTSPTSSVFSVGSAAGTNPSATMIAYCFAEKQGYSKFGSYTGNGNADGTFVYTGFKPAWVMVKASGAATNWTIIDNKRPEYNPANKWLYSNVSDAEYNASEFPTDFTAQGFKIRNTGSYMNTSGANYIYMAFAENPFVTSTGVPACAR